MISKNALLAILLLATPLAACAADDDFADEFAASEDDSLDLDGKADQAGLYTFFTIEHDARKCIYPLCGGWWVARVNRDSTRCTDGRFADKCYVSDLDLSAVGVEYLPADRGVLVRGSIETNVVGSFGNMGRFVATEAWQPGTGATPAGIFALVTPTGVRCITYPCPTYHEAKLNSVLEANIADVDFSPSGATEEQLAVAFDALTQDGVIVAGDRYTVKGPAGRMRARTATEFWTRVQPATPTSCYVGGCSGQVCSSEQGVITSCEFRPEYVCYQQFGHCELQADNTCGWADSRDFLGCLQNPPQP